MCENFAGGWNQPHRVQRLVVGFDVIIHINSADKESSLQSYHTSILWPCKRNSFQYYWLAFLLLQNTSQKACLFRKKDIYPRCRRKVWISATMEKWLQHIQISPDRVQWLFYYPASTAFQFQLQYKPSALLTSGKYWQKILKLPIFTVFLIG